MKILLTGANGYLGRELATELAKRHELKVVAGRADFPLRLAQCGHDFDLLIHAGFEVDFSQESDSVVRNMISAKAVVNFLSEGNARRLLFLSGAAVMGVGDSPIPRDESCFGLTDPRYPRYRSSAYVRAKVGCEELLRTAPVPFTALYPSTVYGRGMKASTLRALRGMLAPAGGTSLLDIHDFLSAVSLWLENPQPGRFLLNGANLTYAELGALARQGRRPLHLPRFARHALPLAGALLSPFLPGYSVLESSFGYKYYSSSLFERSYGWSARHTPAAALSSLADLA